VNLQELKANPAATRQSAATTNDSSDVVKGGYQSILLLFGSKLPHLVS
jgi:hypothetical protein